jgi:hypothetical protein
LLKFKILLIYRQQLFYGRFKNRGPSLNQSDRRERGFNRPRFLNYKTRVVFKIFSNTNILAEILINSEIIPKYHKLFEARHNTQNAKIGVGTMVVIQRINKF